MRWRILARAVLTLCFAGILSPTLSQLSPVVRAAPSPEYLIKAAYLYNFALFVEWPAEVFATRDAPIVIGIIGADPFDQALERTIQDKRINGRTLVVRRLQPGQDVRQAHILFVRSSEASRNDELIARLAGRPVLLVGETPDFARRGGTITFTIEDERVRFEINAEAARRARLNVSATLLNVARVVRSNPRTS
ncbi:MAG: YfiR family protein [Vicinamibacterales bacterium]